MLFRSLEAALVNPEAVSGALRLTVVASGTSLSTLLNANLENCVVRAAFSLTRQGD